MANIRLGDILVEYGYITEEQITTILQLQKTDRKKRVGELLLQEGYITEDQLLIALGERLELTIVDMRSINVDLEVVKQVPRNLCMKYCVLPISKKGNIVTIAVNDPLEFYAIEDVKSFLQEQVEVVLCKKDALTNMIRTSYAEIESRNALRNANLTTVKEVVSSNISIDTTNASDAPIVSLVNNIILKAHSQGASDIHFEPFEKEFDVRFRVDGQLLSYMKLEPSLASQIAIRIKIISELDIAERRIPQDGNFKVQIADNDVGIRCSVLPTVFGEKIVLRFLSQNARLDHAQTYGMNERNYEIISRILENPHGIVYITGPTGSGKTTSLYMMIQKMVTRPINISTIEDPVERNLEGVIQVQVNPKAGLTFGGGLRSLLRQDPDVILVGETRDQETAQIAVSAANTGHLVLSTLHTNDAISSIARLKDMGVQEYLIASSLIGVVAQRLVKKICPLCKESYTPSDAQKAVVGDVPVLYHGTGCSDCGHTGYKGRIAIHEVLEIDRTLRTMISMGARTEEIYDYVKQKGSMSFMEDDVHKLVVEGITTYEEYRKNTVRDI